MAGTGDGMRRALLVTVWILAAAPGLAADLHVASDGDDAADGTRDRPVASLQRAVLLARAIRGREPRRSEPLVIELGPGRHELRSTLVLGPDDSGTAESPLVIRGAAGGRPVVSGGRVIKDWAVESDGAGERWTAPLPDVVAGGWNPCELFVSGRRRLRPRMPRDGWHTITAAVPPSPAAADRGHDRFACASDMIRDDWSNLGDVEVVVPHQWSMSRLTIAALEPPGADGARVVQLRGPTASTASWCSLPAGSRFLVENVREAAHPGSWYLDRPTGVLHYWPLPGETPANAEVVAPRLDRLIEVRGDPDRPVGHVMLEGLTLAHAGWTTPPTGHSFPQADVDVGGAVSAVAATRLVLRDCRIRHVGRYAVEFGAACRDCAVERCDLADLGGGGVLIGTVGGPGSWGAAAADGAAVRAISVRDTTIRHGGRLHPAAVGVWIGHASDCVVEHCEIHDLTYTGVSVGWSWGYDPTRAARNRIAFNRIHDIGRGVLSDLAGVYTLGVSPGTEVVGNVIHDVASHDYGGWGLYTDEGSSGIVLRDNVVFRTTTGGFHQHYGRGNLVENNVFAQAGGWQLERTRVEDHVSFGFVRNVVWWSGDAEALVKGDWSRGLRTASNCYWNAAGPVVFPEGLDLAARQAAGQDLGSVVADPRLADPGSGDVRMLPDSPLPALGFRPLAPDRVGPRLAPPCGDLPTPSDPWPGSRPLSPVEAGSRANTAGDRHRAAAQ